MRMLFKGYTEVFIFMEQGMIQEMEFSFPNVINLRLDTLQLYFLSADNHILESVSSIECVHVEAVEKGWVVLNVTTDLLDVISIGVDLSEVTGPPASSDGTERVGDEHTDRYRI